VGEEDKCVCVSSSHNHDEPCGKPSAFRVKARGSSRVAGICKDCYGKPFVELPLEFYTEK